MGAQEEALAQRMQRFSRDADNFKRQHDADIKKKQSELEAHHQAQLAELDAKAAELVSHTVPMKPCSCCLHGQLQTLFAMLR